MDSRIDSLSYLVALSLTLQRLIFRWMRSVLIFIFLAALGFAGNALYAQPTDRIAERIDPTQTRMLPNHHPQWANARNSVGLAASDLVLTMVLSRSPEQEAAFERLLKDQ